MPIYAYRCEHCAFQKDVLQKMSDPLLVTCPSCGEATFRKQVTAAGFQLKGSGWYVTDFRNPAATKEAKDPKDARGDGPSPDAAAKSDAAPSESKGGGEAAAPGPKPVAPATTDTKSATTGSKPAAPSASPPAGST